MRNARPAESPAAFVAKLDGWQAKCVRQLRFVVRAEPQRVQFGFWRGKRLRSIEPRLKPGGKYEMASLELHEDTAL